MADGKRCMSCMCGTIENGVCNNCHRREKETPANALQPGTLLHNRYYLGNVLGQGGFGITYAAWDQKENRRVAIKELYPSSDVRRNADRCTVQVIRGQEAYFSKVCDCFEKEAQMLMHLQGVKGIITLYHVFSDYNTLYYAMEYLDGWNLNAFLMQNGRMQWETLAPIARELLSAMERLHAVGLIHRDISPDNIFLTKDGGQRLIDFGSVRVFQGQNHFTAFVKKNFAPWEQFKTDGQQGPWTDIYSFCVTLYFALSGQLPPLASNRRLQDTVIPVGQLCPGLPAYVDRAIMYGMAVRAEERCQSVGELRSLLFGEERGKQSPRLICHEGYHRGKEWLLDADRTYRIGRQRDCEILYPVKMPGVSHIQCTLYVDDKGQVLVRDENSRYGTYLGKKNGSIRLESGQWYLANGCWILFGEKEQFFIQ